MSEPEGARREEVMRNNRGQNSTVISMAGFPFPACPPILSGIVNPGGIMPEKATIKRARRDARQGKALSTQAGEFVREEMHHIREGKHGARSAKHAIAIGLSKARRAGVKLPAQGKMSRSTRRKARQDLARGRKRRSPSRTRSRARLKALRREPRRAASHRALSRQAHQAARRRSPAERSRAAQKAARTRQHTTA